MDTVHLSSSFVFQRGTMLYTVEFKSSVKRWYIYQGELALGIPLTEVAWNGIYNPPRADCAETVLHEYLNVD